MFKFCSSLWSKGPLVAMEPVAKRIRKIAGLGGVTDTALLRIFAALRDDRGLIDEATMRVSSGSYLP